jgi:signal transduction histidine kinase
LGNRKAKRRGLAHDVSPDGTVTKITDGAQLGSQRELDPVTSCNACLHSQARQLRVELSYAQDLSLRICDNGTGINPDILRRGKPGHFGLQSMRERAARSVGKFSVESSAGSGTVITLTVPGGIIYRTVHCRPLTPKYIPLQIV